MIWRVISAAGRSRLKEPTTWPTKNDSSLSAPSCPASAAASIRCQASLTSIGCSGSGSGGGLPGRSHSSCQALRSCRAGLPVRVGERSVSELVARRNLALMASLATSSSLDSHTEPHHTPAAPRASAAAICRPEAMPPAASTGRLPAMSTISGVRTMVAIVPVWPPASVPWAISRSRRPRAGGWRAWAGRPGPPPPRPPSCPARPGRAGACRARWRSARSGGRTPRPAAPRRRPG